MRLLSAKKKQMIIKSWCIAFNDLYFAVNFRSMWSRLSRTSGNKIVVTDKTEIHSVFAKRATAHCVASEDVKLFNIIYMNRSNCPNVREKTMKLSLLDIHNGV